MPWTSAVVKLDLFKQTKIKIKSIFIDITKATTVQAKVKFNSNIININTIIWRLSLYLMNEENSLTEFLVIFRYKRFIKNESNDGSPRGLSLYCPH